MSKKRSKSDMHRADIVAAVFKAGTSLSKLGKQNGLASSTLKNALDKRYPKGEKIIADAIGIPPEDIWPSRYSKHEAHAVRAA